MSKSQRRREGGVGGIRWIDGRSTWHSPSLPSSLGRGGKWKLVSKAFVVARVGGQVLEVGPLSPLKNKTWMSDHEAIHRSENHAITMSESARMPCQG